MTQPQNGVPYETFVDVSLTKLRTLLGDAETVSVTEVLAHAEFAMHTTRMLLTGPSVDTQLRNTVTRATATRVINKSGIPTWAVTQPDGSYSEVQEAMLLPEADWKCVYNPDIADEEA